MYTIEKGDVEEITDRLNPRALTKCKTNTLYMTMKVHDIWSPWKGRTRIPCTKVPDGRRKILIRPLGDPGRPK